DTPRATAPSRPPTPKRTISTAVWRIGPHMMGCAACAPTNARLYSRGLASPESNARHTLYCPALAAGDPFRRALDCLTCRANSTAYFRSRTCCCFGCLQLATNLLQFVRTPDASDPRPDFRFLLADVTVQHLSKRSEPLN